MDIKRRDLKTPLPSIWNRLEPRPLQKDFSRVLRAEVYDPLWMLNRQWQFGEFKGEDTGSSVFAHIQLQHTQLTRYAANSTAVELYTEELPLEVKVESEGVTFDLKLHLQLSLYFKKLLQKTPALPTGLYSAFVNTYTLTLPTFNSLEEEAQYTTQSGSWLLWKTAAGKGLLDGNRLYTDLTGNLSTNTPISNLIIFNNLTPTQEQALNKAAINLVNWLEKTYVTASSAWKAERLEYQFANSAPNPQNGQPQALTVEEHYQGKLDWFAYTIDNNTPNAALMNSTPLTGENTAVHTENITVLPAPVRFAGMPMPRWWEMEDGYINLGDLAQDTTEVPKVLLAQFGLVFNNDWQMVPMRRPIGSLSQVSNLVVTDVFGQKTAITTANKEDDNWSLYSLNHKDSDDLDGRLFIPPTVDKTLESDPIEVVRFARDEMANQVWAIEQQVPSLMGEGMDARVASEAIKQQLAATLLAQIPVAPSKNLTAYYAMNGDASDLQSFLHGTMNNVNGVIGPWGTAVGALGFTGTANSYISLPNDALIKPSSMLSISLWVQPSTVAPQEQYIVFTSNNESIDKQAYALSIRNNKFRGYKNAPAPFDTNSKYSATLRTRSSTVSNALSHQLPSISSSIAVIDSTTTVQANTWYHLTFTISTTQLKLYINGILEATVEADHAFDYKIGATVVLGGTNTSINAPFAGSISELRFYDRALDGEEVTTLYNNGQPFPALAPQVQAESLQPADYIYHYLLNDVPENWIPFLPVRLPGSNELVLQRGKMQRNLPHLPEELQYIYPLGTLLKEHTQTNPNLYFLKEEEVPRGGIEITRTFQRTRWINGKVFTWLGRQKRAGKGDLNSNLQFDSLEAFDEA